MGLIIIEVSFQLVFWRRWFPPLGTEASSFLCWLWSPSQRKSRVISAKSDGVGAGVTILTITSLDVTHFMQLRQAGLGEGGFQGFAQKILFPILCFFFFSFSDIISVASMEFADSSVDLNFTFILFPFALRLSKTIYIEVCCQKCSVSIFSSVYCCTHFLYFFFFFGH